IEEKRFLPIGSDVETTSEFQLLAGTNRDLPQLVAQGRFREDLLARINLWTFRLPPLKDRREDIEPNLEYELGQFAKRTRRTVSFAAEARSKYLEFATSAAAQWPSNFRDLSASITRMATLAPAGRISTDGVATEVARLTISWSGPAAGPDLCSQILGHAHASQLDRFERTQLADVLEACKQSRSLSEAGRLLFAQSRQSKTSTNDADRLRKYLARFALTWDALAAAP
ncbi:MAG: sigma 54-interacting transcriptional regulator, partial [bacterium]|nr:sigma 54-interacting transcriptional regulator [bacterium]